MPNAPAAQPSTPPLAGLIPAPTTASVSATNDPGWRAALGNWLAARKRYPEQAQRRRDQYVGVRFTVDPTGRVLDVAITHSSGSTLLDNAARDMLAGQRVPPFPSGMTLALTTVPVNIRFQLEQ